MGGEATDTYDIPPARGLACAALASLAPMMAALSLGFTSPAAGTMEDMVTDHEGDAPAWLAVFKDSHGLFSWFSSIVNVGAVVGAFAGGDLCARVGKRNVLRLSAVLVGVPCLCIAFMTDPGWIVACRFPMGLGVGLQSVATPALLAELSPARFRGSVGTANAAMILVGVLIIQAVGGSATRAEHGVYCDWRALAAFVTAMCGVCFVGFLFLPKPKPAMAYSPNASVSFVRSLVLDPEDGRSSPKETWKMVLAGLVPMLWQQLSGINSIIFFGQRILSAAGITDIGGLGPNVIGDSIIAVQLLGIFVAALLVDRVGRRPLLLMSSLGMSASALAIALLLGAKSPPAAVVLVAMYGYVIFFALGLGPVPWLLLPELGLRKSLRLKMAAVATASNWAASFAVTGPPLQAIQDAWGLNGVFFVFSGSCILGFLLMFLFVPETKGMYT